MSEPRGRALIISNKCEVGKDWREGADTDHINMRRALEKLGFIVTGNIRNYTAKVWKH